MTETEYLLNQLIGECAEVQHRAIKALHFGLTETEPGQSKTNAKRLIEELADLEGSIELLEDHNVLDFEPIEFRGLIEAKKQKVQRYMDYSRSLGILEPKSTEEPVNSEFKEQG